MDVDDLSNSELRARLLQRGLPEPETDKLVRLRDDDHADVVIRALLDA